MGDTRAPIKVEKKGYCCQKCEWVWVPRTINPASCPRCKNPRWWEGYKRKTYRGVAIGNWWRKRAEGKKPKPEPIDLMAALKKSLAQR